MTTQQILQEVHDWTNGKIVYDISVAHPDGQGKPTPYADLTAALGTGGANIPEPLRKGGMSVKFIKGSVQSSDNEYVQYFLTKNSWSASEADWIKLNPTQDIQNDKNSVPSNATLYKIFCRQLYGTFVRGTLRDGILSSFSYRVATDDILSYDRDVQIVVSENYRFGIHYFVNGVFTNDSGWLYNTCTIKKGETFKIVIARVDETDTSTADISEFLSKIRITNIIDYIDNINTKLSFSTLYNIIPTRNGSNGNEGNQYAVVWLDIPCAGYSKIRFRVKKPFASVGNIFVFCYTLPNGSFRDAIEADYNRGFYQDTTDKWMELSTEGLSSITIQVYETSLPMMYPTTFNSLRKGDFIGGQCLEYFFLDENSVATKGDLDEINENLDEINENLDEINENVSTSLSRVIKGMGETFSNTFLYGLQKGKTYVVHLSKISWDITGVTGGNRLAISNWYNGVYTYITNFWERFPSRHDIKFTVPENSDYIAIGGRAAIGENIFYHVTDSQEAEQMIVNKKKVTNNCGNQGLTIVGDTIIQFNGGADDHSSYSSVLRWNKNDFSSITQMTHNLGHAATIDYNEEVDALVVGNGTSDTSIAPRLDIVLNAYSKFTGGGQINYDSSDIIHIELKTDVKELGGSGLICCFGGNWREVYLATGQNAPRKIFRCILGVGAEDFSDSSADQNDVTRWGTFISDKSDTEYNGTLKVISTYTGDETQVYQGMCYRAGFIYLACGYSNPLIHKIRLYKDGEYKIVQTNVPQSYTLDGSMSPVEPEGLCFYDSTSILIGLPAYGGLYTIESF